MRATRSWYMQLIHISLCVLSHPTAPTRFEINMVMVTRGCEMHSVCVCACLKCSVSFGVSFKEQSAWWLLRACKCLWIQIPSDVKRKSNWGFLWWERSNDPKLQLSGRWLKSYVCNSNTVGLKLPLMALQLENVQVRFSSPQGYEAMHEVPVWAHQANCD